nr:structural protein [Tolivirales sp.]
MAKKKQMVGKRIKVVVQPKKKMTKQQEVTAVGRALRALGGLGGGYAGGLLGNAKLGSAAGTGLGAIVSRWLGQGDYSVQSNSLLTSVRPDGTIPAMHKDGQSVVVRHKEFLGEILGSTSYTVQKRYALNPGDSATFPWLAAIAGQYTEYKVRGMIFHYIPTSGMAVNSTNPALGSVMIQTSYRATEAAPSSKVEMMNEYWATEARPSDPFIHPVECDPKENPFNVQYVRNSSVASTENILMYDLGVTTVATTGCPADGNVLGDLWCTYEIELKKPKIANITTETALSASNFAQGSLSGATLWSTPAASFVSIPGITIAPTGLTVGREVQGTYLLAVSLTSATTIGSPATVLGAGMSIKFSSNVTAVGSSSALSVAVVQIVPAAASRTIGFTLGTLTGTNILASLRLTEYNSNALI